jgi:DNA repair protein RadC
MVNAVQVKLVKTPIDLGTDIIPTLPLAAKMAKEYMEGYCSNNRENIILICVSRDFQVNAIHTLAVGVDSQVTFNAPDIFRVCLLSNSLGFILAHNHPNGVCEPSDADLSATRALKKAAKTIGLRLLDHLIIGDNLVHSMRECGQIR